MGEPAGVLGDKIMGMCAGHLIPAPTPPPAPITGPPMPFQAPVTLGAATKVLINNKPALVMGANGLNLPPHVGLHPTDPFMVPATQKGTIVKGSTSVLIENKPAAKMGSDCVICFGVPTGKLVATGTTVLIGG